MKKKNIILIGIIIILLVGAFVLTHQKDSYAVGEGSGSVSLSCNNSLSSGSSMTCTLNGTVSGTLYKGISADLSLSSNLEFVSFTKSDPNDFGSGSSTRLVLASSVGKSGTFEIGKYVIKAKSGVSGSNDTMALSNVQFSNENDQPFGVTGTTKNIRIPSTNNNLSSLSVSGTSISFNPNTTTYNVTVNSSSTTINASKADSNATISGDTGSKSLNYGVNTYRINVKNEAGVTKTYTINITRPDTRSSNNNLKSLSLSSGNISFNKNTTSYNVNVGSDVSSIKISASLEDSKSSFVNGYNPRTVNLNYGNNTVVIKAVAENGNVKAYTITINRVKKGSSASNSNNTKSNTTKTGGNKESNNKLKTLYLSKGAISFDDDKTTYEVSVPYGVSSLEISGEVASSKAKVEGLGKHKLNVGENKIEIKVIAENGDVKTYTIKVTRREKSDNSKLDTNNYLKSLTIEGYELEFDKDNLSYEIKLNGNKTLKIKAYAESKKAQVSIIGNEDLKDKDEVKVIVTAEDGDNRIYTITVHDTNNLLYTAIGIFIIGVLSVSVAVVYKKRKNMVE